MAFATRAALLAVRDLLAQCAGVDLARVGVPESLSSVRVVSVSVLDSPPGRMALGTQGRDQHFLVLWEAVVARQEEQVELDVADFKDDLWRRFLGERKAGPLAGARLDDTLASSPEYRPRSGQEVRAYPVIVTLPMTEDLP